MAFFALPVMVVLFFIGVAAQMNQLALAVAGAGKPGQMENFEIVSAQRVEAFAAACLDTAIASPGAISASLTVAMPTGATTPVGAVCMTTPAAGGARNVYAYAPVVGGAAGQMMTDTQRSAAWYRVQSQGQAVNVQFGDVSAVPASLPVGALLEWVQVTP
ncbi:hypothetical protein [Trinickia fusca]|uniref:Uncharacterized protein n=1 Tax=Trinickia fusca TaxID=2419777 RepID=A0A494XJ28_9BURK|nr:hypothetical protein [Trinickia fusca]RKP47563.1 hypothetical protein D7S89_15155 [Trinickia fusca]